MNRLRFACVVLVTLAVASSFASVRAQDLLIKDARVVTCAGKEHAIANVLIKGGRIAAIGRDVKGDGVPELQARGKTVMPGFVLAHSWLGLDSRNRNEMIDVTPYLSVLDAIDPSLPFYEDCLRDGHLTICVMPGNSAAIAGMGRIVRPWGATVEAMTVDAEPGLKISMIPRTGRGNRAAWVAKIRKEFEAAKRAVSDAERDSKKEATGNVGFDLEAMGVKKRQLSMTRLLKGDLRAHIACATAGDVVQAMKLIRDYDLKAVLVCSSGTWRAAKHIAKSKLPVVLTGALTFRDQDMDTGKEIERNLPKIFSDAGVRFALMTSTGSLGSRYAWYQAACLVRYGMSREDALAAVTRIPAEIIGVGERKGSIVVGKDADLIVLTDDPLSGRAWVDQGVIGGRVVYERSKDPRLAEIFGGGR